MADIVNLRAVRKRVTRAREDAEAGVNRLAHGRPAAKRKQETARRDQDTRRIEGHRIEPGDTK